MHYLNTFFFIKTPTFISHSLSNITGKSGLSYYLVRGIFAFSALGVFLFVLK